MGNTAYLWVTVPTPALFETRIVDIDVYGDLAWYSDRTNDFKPRAVLSSCEDKQLAVMPVKSFCFSGPQFLHLCNKRLKLVSILVS